jgi:hypothetical protein
MDIFGACHFVTVRAPMRLQLLSARTRCAPTYIFQGHSRSGFPTLAQMLEFSNCWSLYLPCLSSRSEPQVLLQVKRKMWWNLRCQLLHAWHLSPARKVARVVHIYMKYKNRKKIGMVLEGGQQ